MRVRVSGSSGRVERVYGQRLFPLLALGFCTVAAASLFTAALAEARAPAPKIKTLSNRADLVADGDVLIQVTLPPGVKRSRLKLTAGRRNVTRVLRRGAGRRNLIGLVRGLPLGRSALIAHIRGGADARLFVTNHPSGGPVFAGPQIRPWPCQDGALDLKCNQPPTFEFLYLPEGAPMSGGGVPGLGSNGASPFAPYDPENPPDRSSIETATTTEGVKVPFIIRLETGYLDRDQYAVATLFDPEKRWKPTRPQRQFNRRLVITHGFSCDTEYGAAEAPSVLIPRVLAGGFIVMSHALDHAGHNCNLLTQAESLVMTKEHVIDNYGRVRWTIGSGCSGGSLAQHQVANAYPGIYQGIIPQCSFPDTWSSAMQYIEYLFGLKYFADPSRWDPGTVYEPAAIMAFNDHPNLSNPVTFTSVIPNSGEPSRSCPGVPAEQVYDENTNPDGVRCTLQDYMVNAFGRDRRGFARRPFDNVGIQYGFKGLRQGLISPVQFVDFNTNIGGADIDLNITAQRTAADPIALRRLYRTGAINTANNLNRVAIIDLRGPDPGFFHDVFRTYALRARLIRAHGTAANQVLWRGLAALIGDPSYADAAVFAMDRWLARVHADRRDIPLSRKIILDKPDNLAARCTNGAGTNQPAEVCDNAVASYGTPRQGAGGPLTEDVMKCHLKPMRRDDYPVTFTDSQWNRLRQAFPGGVCDYRRIGVAQRGAIPWLTYQDRRGRVIYGGKPMGPPPRSHRLR